MKRDWAFRIAIAIGLIIDAYVHLHLAKGYSGDTISQGQLFYVEGISAIVGTILVLAWRSRWSLLFALALTVGGVAAVLLYRYVNVGAIGPLPQMYEPAWYTEKTISAIAETVAAVLAAVLLVTTRRSNTDQ